jgi:hypothetical protein
MTPQEKKLKRKEINKKYNMTVREHWANNLHPDSIVMESPHFNPLLISPSPQLPKAPSDDMEIPKLIGTPVDIAQTAVQNPESSPLNWLWHRPYIDIEWPLEREMPFYPIVIRFLKQTLEERVEGARMESAMIRTA